jgi:2-oxoglutarate ferredoxin oxidoreductase subunit delta
LSQAAVVQQPRANVVILEERCKACELCVPACPKDCIEKGTKINGQGFAAAAFARAEECTGCAICAEACPDVCIQVWR